jgi:hypothetical protein
VNTNYLAKAFWLGCAASACHPTVQPVPTPVPTVTADAGAPTGAHPFIQPTCNPPTLRGPDPKLIEEYKRSLPPRHKITETGFTWGLAAPVVQSVGWLSNNRFCGNQKKVGACEAFTQLDIACAQPRGLSFQTQDAFNSAALKAYEWITANDPFPGTWPPDDTGSDSMTGCKWLVKNGYASSCQVLTGASAVKVALQTGPVISGMYWRDRMMLTDQCGYMDISGSINGGHAVGIFQFNAQKDEWDLLNHWDDSWGVRVGGQGGHFILTTAQLFSPELDADFVQPVL